MTDTEKSPIVLAAEWVEAACERLQRANEAQRRAANSCEAAVAELEEAERSYAAERAKLLRGAR